MKKYFVLVLLLNFSLTAFSQDDDAVEAADAVDDMSMDNYAYENTVDTITIETGKPIMLLIDINEYGVSSNEDNSERDELIANFNDNLRVKSIRENTFLILENNQTIDLSDGNQEYQHSIFWSGKDSEDLLESPYNFNLTEFAAQQMGLDKQSSYNLNVKKYRKDIDKLLASNNVTEASKAVMKAYFNYYINQVFSDNLTEWLSFNPKNIKTCTLQLKRTGEEQKKIRKITFNEIGQITEMESFEDEGESNKINFNYINGILTNMSSPNRDIKVYYSNDKMILQSNVGEADETIVFSIKNEKLVSKNYLLMLDDEYAKQNYLREIKFEGNCEITTINNVVWTKECAGAINNFPYIREYTSFQDGEILQYRKYKVEKKNGQLFEIAYSNAETLEEKDSYELSGKFEINSNGNLSKYTKSGGKDQIVVNYTYEYYK